MVRKYIISNEDNYVQQNLGNIKQTSLSSCEVKYTYLIKKIKYFLNI